MNLFLKIIIYSALGLIFGYFGLGGFLFYNMEYSFTSSFIALVFSFILVANTKNNYLNLLYQTFFSIGSFLGIDFEIPQTLISFLSISEEYSWFISLIVGLTKLSVGYLMVLLKIVCIDKENLISNRIKNVNFELKIVLFSLVLTFFQIAFEYIFPAQMGYILNEHVDQLNLLPLIGISGYTYFLTFLCLLISFSIKEKRFKLYSSYLFILFHWFIWY